MKPRLNPERSRLLLIRLREIGDVVFTTPAIHALREHVPASHLTYLVEPAAADVVRANPHLDEVLIAPPRGAGVRAEATLIRALRAGRFDLVIDFHGGPRASILAWLSGAPVRIGYEVAGRTWMYTHTVARARELRPRHSVANQMDLLAVLGIHPTTPEAHRVEMEVDAHAAARLSDRLTRSGVRHGDRLIAIHVSAGNPFRRWPLDSFAAAVAALAADDRNRIVLTSGPSDRPAADRVIADARRLLPVDARPRIAACGDLSLAELRALVARAAVYIGGDSGPMHVAATSDVPIVALYGPTLPARSAPWRPADRSVALEIHGLPCRPCDQRVCAPGDFRCLTRIRPDEVVQAAMDLLERSSGKMVRF
jgi:ADP-heptose:LPS heptosyltransferase